MRTVNIVLLVLAGALAGALLMKVAQRPARIAMRPAAAPAIAVSAPPQAVAPTAPQASPIESKPPQVSETRPPAQPALMDATPAPETNHPLERKPSPMPRVPAEVPLAISPRFHHTQPQHVELQASRAAVSAAAASPMPSSPPMSPEQPKETPSARQAPRRAVSAQAASPIPSPPPVLPEQPKETPPARMETENVTPPSAPVAPAPQPNQATLNAGMLIPVRLLDSLSSERNQAGDAFAATLDHELVANGFVVAERGARVEGRVTAADRSGRRLSLELTFVHTSDDQDVAIQTERFDKRGEPDRTAAAAKIGAGAAIGAVVGGIAGGGKGAAIGAGAGGGIGAGDVMLSRQPAALRTETRLTFRLRAPVTVTERTQQ